MKRLHKSIYDKKLCGVCGGIAEYFDLDPSIVRIVAAILILFGGVSAWIYIIAALILPEGDIEE